MKGEILKLGSLGRFSKAQRKNFKG